MGQGKTAGAAVLLVRARPAVFEDLQNAPLTLRRKSFGGLLHSGV